MGHGRAGISSKNQGRTENELGKAEGPNPPGRKHGEKVERLTDRLND